MNNNIKNQTRVLWDKCFSEEDKRFVDFYFEKRYNEEDNVFIEKGVGIEMEYEGEEYLVVTQKDILAVIK